MTAVAPEELTNDQLMPSDPPHILRAVRTYARTDKERGMKGVQVTAGQHVLVVHHVLGNLARRFALIKFCEAT